MRVPFVVVLLITLGTARDAQSKTAREAGERSLRQAQAQITDPVPERVEKRGLMVEIRDVARLPMTRGMRPPDQDVNPAGWARVSFVRELPDGRRFANDSRGFLYLLEGGDRPTVYLDFAALFPFAN